jgi:hypothetical protein
LRSIASGVAFACIGVFQLYKPHAPLEVCNPKCRPEHVEDSD